MLLRLTVMVIGEAYYVGDIILDNDAREYDGVITLTVLAAY